MRIKGGKDIVDVLARCELHWGVSRTPEPRVEEMREELHQHLHEAVRDGKPVESVVDDDVLAFAESWAREDRPSWPMYRRVAWFGHLTLVMMSVVVTLMHPVPWDLAVPVGWSEAALLLLTAGVAWGLSELTSGERNGVILLWPWYATVVVAIPAFATGRLGEPERPA